MSSCKVTCRKISDMNKWNHMTVIDDTHMPSYSVLYWSRLMKTTLTAMQSVMKSSTKGSNTMKESTSEILIQA